MRILIDGRAHADERIDRVAGPSETRKMTARWKVRWAAGEHDVRVEAHNKWVRGEADLTNRP